MNHFQRAWHIGLVFHFQSTTKSLFRKNLNPTVKSFNSKCITQRMYWAVTVPLLSLAKPAPCGVAYREALMSKCHCLLGMWPASSSGITGSLWNTNANYTSWEHTKERGDKDDGKHPLSLQRGRPTTSWCGSLCAGQGSHALPTVRKLSLHLLFQRRQQTPLSTSVPSS